MSDAAHGVPGQTSDFEYKLVKPFVADAPSVVPCSGKYAGWFNLMMNGKVIKIEENNLMVNFTAVVNSSDTEGVYTVVGDGTNKFGKFSVKGKYSKAEGVHLYKEYVYTPVPTSSKKRSAPSSAGASPAKQLKSGDGAARPPPLNMTGLSGSGSGSATPGGATTPGGSFTPREGSGRARKPSIHVMEAKADLPPPQPKPTPKSTPKAAPPAAKPATTPKAAAAPKAPKAGVAAAPAKPLVLSAAEAAAAAKKAESNRAQRLSQAMVKCSDLLKELMRHPSGVYFLVPVDPVRLQCPDYPTVITQPMDFGTIQQRLEQGVISTMEEFAEHVRLVMRNALTYNVASDSVVHVAAKALSTRFEDKFTKISAAFVNQQQLYQDPNAAIAAAAKSSKKAGGGKQATGAGKHRASTGSISSAKQAVGGGPPAYVAPVMNESAHHILEMQKMMAEMQAEINKLRSTVMHNEVKSDLEEKKIAAQHPLTFEEKKKLIEQIGGLAPLKMQQVVEIIQAAVAASGQSYDDDVEIPLDDLDTFTLRRLQRFVEQDATDRRKRSSGGADSSGPGRKSTGAPRGRKPNPEKAAARAAQAQAQAEARNRGAYFAPESFDTLRGDGGAEVDGYAIGEDLGGEGLDLDLAEAIPPNASAPSTSSSSEGHSQGQGQGHSHSHTTTHTASAVAVGTVGAPAAAAAAGGSTNSAMTGMWSASAQVTHSHTVVHSNSSEPDHSLPTVTGTGNDDGDYMNMDQQGSQGEFEEFDTDNL